MAALLFVSLLVFLCVGLVCLAKEGVALQDIQAVRKDVFLEMKALTEDEKGEDREMSEADETRFGELKAKLEKLDGEIKSIQEKNEKVDARRKYLAEQEAKLNYVPNSLGTGSGDMALVTRVHERSLDDAQRGFKSLGEFAQLVEFEQMPGHSADERLRVLAGPTGMGAGIGADGGYLIPPAFANTIWDGVMTASDSLLRYCDVYTVEPGVESITFPAIAETSRAVGSRWGGIRGYWTEGEASSMTASKPSFRQVTLRPHEMAVFAYATNKLLRNSPIALGQFLERAARDEINFKIGDSFIEGDGAGKPAGIKASSATVSVAKEIGQLGKTFVAENAMKIFSRCHLRSLPNAVWFINQDVLPQLMSMFLSNGTGGVPIYLPANSLAPAPFGTLLGRPVMPIEYMETLGTEGDVGLYDLSAYAVGLRGMVDSQASIHLAFDTNQTAFRFIFEIDGQPWIDSPITPFKGAANTVSPFVNVAVRA